jgi:phosphate transport system permease protein
MSNHHNLSGSIDVKLHQPLSLTRIFFSRCLTFLAFSLTALALLPLFAILSKIVAEGFGHLSWEVLVSLPAPVGVENQSNGFANAIVGTFVMVGIATLFSLPIGVMTGIFLAEFAKNHKIIGHIIRFITVILSSVPSIVIGVFAYALIVVTTKTFSALAGSFALSMIMLPIVALTTEEALKLVPTSYRLASAALGGGRFQTLFGVILPSALPTITTGVLLAAARAAGETAPLIVTSLSSQFWPENLLSPSSSMSVLIYSYASSPYKEQNELAWTAGFVLLGMVLLSNILSRIFTSKQLKLR